MSSTAANEPFVNSPGATPAEGSANPLVYETRREIAEIVREIADAVRSDRSAEEFLDRLVDRILRAMAAEGVMVWQRLGTPTSTEQAGDTEEFCCVRRLGRVTDQSIPPESQRSHKRLLWEAAQDRQPVVVPASPGASNSEVPANPLDVPVALAAIDIEHSQCAEYLLEVCLEPDCGAVTQRGYLRFVSQMADLAGEFLRVDRQSHH